MTFAKKVILGVGSLLLVIGLSGNVFAQADTQPEQINPDAPEELKVGEPKYKANADKEDGLKSKEEIEAKITKKAKVKNNELKLYKNKKSFKGEINHDVSPDRQVYEVEMEIADGVILDGGRCKKDAKSTMLFDAETGDVIGTETRCAFANYEYSHPVPGTQGVPRITPKRF